jgi:hypothetical protein
LLWLSLPPAGTIKYVAPPVSEVTYVAPPVSEVTLRSFSIESKLRSAGAPVSGAAPRRLSTWL